MILRVAALLLPALAALAWLIRFGGRRDVILWIAIAPLLGLGAASLVWWLLMWMPLGTAGRLVSADVMVWVLVAAAAFLGGAPTVAADGPRPRQPRWLVLAALALLVPITALAAASFVGEVAVSPHGEWDAWDLWNQRARFLFRGYPGDWLGAFSPLLNWFRPHYPLLLPLTVARGWMYLGRDFVAAPIGVAVVFTASTAVMVTASVARRRGAARGLAAAALLLASPAYVTYAAWQFADIPIACFFVMTFILIDQALASPRAAVWWTLAGASAGLAAWTKNEGLVFAGLTIAVCSLWAFRRERRGAGVIVTRLILGATPALLAYATFKIWLAPPDDFTTPLSVSYISKTVTDAGRFGVVAGAIGRELWLGGAATVGALPLFMLYVILSGWPRPLPPAPVLCAVVVALVVAADAFVYQITPFPLEWHLRTSLSRVLVQVWPSIVWAGAMVAGSTPPAVAAPSAPSAQG